MKARDVKKLADLFMCLLEDAIVAVFCLILMTDDVPKVAELIRLTSVALFQTVLTQIILVVMQLMV